VGFEREDRDDKRGEKKKKKVGKIKDNKIRVKNSI
jgi:hypothetical protein